MYLTLDDTGGQRDKRKMNRHVYDHNVLAKLTTHTPTIPNTTLPTLHAQLGLPPTALHDELSTLQQQLTQCIESQIDHRKKQVDEWMEKCSAVEGECMRYGRALGGHMKTSGPSVGEIRKEQVLPRRFEMVSEHQERLRQQYHTKLEQLLNLTGRLTTLANTLGQEFFVDVMEPTYAPGENEYDTTSYRDVTPERFSRLEKELVRGKAKFSDPFLNASISMAISTPTPHTRTRPITPLLFFSDATPHPTEFVARMEELAEEDLPESHASLGLEGVEPTQALMTWAESTRADLEDTKKRREAHIQAMYDQLEALWRRLGVADADMDAFVEAQRGSTDETIKTYEEELERMLELKRERMGTFIENAREEIIKLWDDLLVGEEERADFAPFADDEHTEELLCLHEQEIKRLKEERRLKEIFDICEDEKELAASASDQSRLLGRGPRDPGRLLREEKMRKRVTKEKPRLEQDLLMSIPAWEAETGCVFLVHGVGIGRSGTVTPAVRPASSMASSHSVPNKRPRLADSTSSVPPVPTRAPLGSSRGPIVNRSASPTKIPHPGKTTSSSLPPQQLGSSGHSYGGYHAAQRATSYGASSTYRGPGATAAVAKKASRARRESFKPRPSVDENWAVDADVGRWRAGLVGVSVKEEDEY
ncbi:microtubule associated protein-domain-containing protein [Epithele typhae]|uniref:microtubule associated protein-domain-containing protein n=1 Tax=Epithele typhae TaxID=378194 RepID=UPI002008DEFE|nr:microtubule associated protein-domain-containing protein [Epithele typhae]KAH9920001.1 microtubule associated protein-domain-containing protein [Epithele typhae]